MTTPLRLLFLSSLLVASACGKSEQTSPTPAPTTSAPAATVSAATTAPSGSATAGASAAPGAAPADAAGETWKASFKTKVSTVELSKDAAADVKVWAKDPGTEFVGDGTLTLTIAGGGAQRAVRGTGAGVLGALTIRGELDGDELRARVDPVDPNDQKAMTGVLTGTRKGDAIEGKLRMSSRNANQVREADVKLTR